MGPPTIHYGIRPEVRAACGHFREHVTRLRSEVTCARCRTTSKFRTGWWSR